MVTIDSILLSDEYNGNQNGGADPGLGYLMGSIGDKMWAVITAEVHWEAKNISITTLSGSPTITRNDCASSTSTGSFITDGFQNGDTVVLAGTSTNDGTYTVLSFTATTMTFTSNLTVSGTWAGANVYGNTPPLAMDFYHNCIPNGFAESFQSLSDNPTNQGNIQKFNLTWTGGSPPANANMNPIGTSLAWYENFAPVINYVGQGGGGALTPYSRIYTIKVPFFIKPFYIQDQLTALQSAKAGNAQPPDFWAALSCLKYIYKLDAKFSATTATVYHTSDPQTFLNGNTGWFNEFLNGGTPVYSLGTVSYVDHTTSAAATTIDYNRSTDITATIQCSASTFANGDKVAVNFMYLPQNLSAYQNTTTKYRIDFLHDRVFTTVGAAGVNGDLNSTGYGSLNNVVLTRNSAAQITLTATITLGANAINVLKAKNLNDLNYLIWVTPQKQAVTTLAGTDRNAVIVDVNLATTDTDDSTGLIVVTQNGVNTTSDILFYRYPDTDVNPVTNFSDFVGSFGYAKCDFLVKSGYQLTGLSVTIQAVQTGFQDTILEQWNQTFTNASNGIFSVPSVNETRGFPLDLTDNRNIRSLNRLSSIDGIGGRNGYGYELIYGFQMGYQDWQQVFPFDPAFINENWQYWATYSNQTTQPSLGSGWQIQFLIQWDILGSNGITTQFQQIADLVAADQTNNSSNVTTSITTQDVSGNSLSGIVASDIQTQITVDITTSVGNLDPPAPYTTVIGKLTFWYDNGSSEVFDYSTTEQANQDNSLWVGQPIVTRVNAAHYTITGVIDLTEGTQPIRSYRIYGQLGYKI